MRIQLNQPGCNDSAQRVAPGDRAGGLTAGRVEEIEQDDLIVEGLFERPAILAVRRASERVALLQECSAGQWITGIGRRFEER